MTRRGEEPAILADTGQVYVTMAAAESYADHVGLQDEEARRRLTVLMLDARRLAEDNRDGTEAWRYRTRSSGGLDIHAHVTREGRLAIVTHVRMRGVPKRAPRERKP